MRLRATLTDLIHNEDSDMSTAYTMLGELIHHCSRCKLDLNHRIILMKGSVPARVLCLTCKSERAYREAAVSEAKPKRKAISSATRAAATASRAKAAALEIEWRQKLHDTGRSPVNYGVDVAFKIDQHVYHPTFGRGVVVGFVHPD